MKSAKREMEKKSEISCFIEELSMIVIVKPSGENLEAAHIPIKPFLSICYLVLQVLDKIGPTMAVLRQDVYQNIKRLELMHESNPTTNLNLVEILKLEATEGNAKKGSSCSKAFVWLTRTLDFTSSLLQILLKDPEKKMEKIVEESYEVTLKQRGDQISISLLKAIGRSRISIVVLSTTYANSRWCMRELEKIMEIGRTMDLIVVPVFYEVDPSEVRHQKGKFGKAFEELISTISVDESTKSDWRRDLIDIGGIAGFVLIDSRNESEDIKNIVERVTRLLDRTELFVAEHPVGLESRVEAATKLLNIKNTEDVLILGIWGMGGMGKTTIAKAIYNQIGSEFEGRSFLLNIREFGEANINLVSLQQQVLCDVYKTTTFKIRDIESGKNMLKEKLAQNKVLFVLDDVNELDQLKALCGSCEWFGPGSRIIITTRDMHLLRSCRVDEVYAIQEMDESESLELFSWHAFKQPIPIEDFATHSTDVVAYSGRLPLALEVLGSYLSDCEITEWQKVLEKLRCIPDTQVQKKLKVSFDGLKDVTEKHIFLDIACFFIGMDRNDVIQILNGCGFFADIGIKVLVERSLVTIDNRNKLRMHDLLRDMGRQIIYEESPFDPEKRSRLWRREQVFDILSKNKGTEAVKGLALEFPRKNTVSLNTKAFKKMNKLRLLQLSGVQLHGDFKYLSGLLL